MKTFVYLALCAAAAAATAQAADCDRMCTQELAYVCASDGKTYNNKCVFEIAKCKANDASLKIVKEGECDTTSSPGTPQCSQEFACLDVYKPVCGSDGKTYSNDCVLKKAQCVNKSILKAGDGECDKSETSSSPPQPTTTPTTSPSTTPKPTTATPTAPTTTPSSQSGSKEDGEVCGKACTKEIAYVCGSDGKSYSNECVLEQEKECKSPMLTKVSDGQCGGSSDANTAPSSPTTMPNGVSSPSQLWAVAASAVIGWGIAALFS